MKNTYKVISEILDSNGYHLFQMMIYHELIFFNSEEYLGPKVDDTTLEDICCQIYDAYLDADALGAEAPSVLAQVGLEMYHNSETKEDFVLDSREFENKVIWFNSIER